MMSVYIFRMVQTTETHTLSLLYFTRISLLYKLKRGCYYGRWSAEGVWERGFCYEINNSFALCVSVKEEKRNEKWGKKGALKDIDELVMMAGAYCMIQDGVQNLNYLAIVFHSFWILYSLKLQLLHYSILY